MIKYIGSKRALLPWIMETVHRIDAVTSVRFAADLFSGTSRVSQALKGAGIIVHANDHTAYAYVLAKALVEADKVEYPPERIRPILARLMDLPPKSGYFTSNYAVEARFFQPHNAARVDAIVAAIDAEADGDPLLRAVLLTSLMLAADRVDSTTGVQMAYLKQWAPRSFNNLALEYPPLLPGQGLASQGDAVEIASSISADLVYLDPPYNQHSYLSNYHIWETLVLNDSPQTYGIARKREDCRTRKSLFNLKNESKIAMARLISSLRVPHVVLSFNNEGYFTTADIEQLLASWGFVVRLTRSHQRYVGARIGIYNPKGEKVGRISHTENLEFLFVATQNRRVYNALQGAASRTEPPQVSLFG